MAIRYFREKKERRMIANLLDVASNEKELEKITALQNEISVAFDSKVLVLTSIKEDRLSAAFGKAMADAYALNGSSALLIDANLFHPVLAELLGITEGKTELEIQPLGEKNGVVALSKRVYPSDFYKTQAIQDLVKESLGKYEHVILLAPSIKEHKEVALFGSILDSVILISRRDETKRRDIFEALSYLSMRNLPVSETVILK